MNRNISVPEALALPDALFVDVRSPAEFKKERIFKAINIPLFDDAEREKIGTLYHQQGKEKAREEGLKIASTRLLHLVQKIEEMAKHRPVVLYCWRGGMRSKALYAILDALDIPCYRLLGGYKSYRRFTYGELQNWKLCQEIIVLHGLTGAGKTRLLYALAQKGFPILELEGLAGHRGSVFGQIGLPAQTSQKDFESSLYHELKRLEPYPYFIVEGEGAKIGDISLPPFLLAGMQQGCHLLLEASLQTRVARLLEEYTPLSEQEKAGALAALQALTPRLGASLVKKMEENLLSNRLEPFIRNLCSCYYDRMYHDSKKTRHRFAAVVDATDLDTAEKQIIAFLTERLKLTLSQI